MKKLKVLFWSLTVSLGGFLFGFDTAVISGAEQAIQQLWTLSDAVLGQTVAMALYGTIIGALTGGLPAQRWGRKRTLLAIGVLYFVSAAGSAIAPNVTSLMIYRFIGGLGVGASSVVGPMYIAEIAPTEQRGRLTALFQFNIIFGILIAYVSNYLIGSGIEDSWRWMLGVEAIPALLFSIFVLLVPESPRWLVIGKKDSVEARRILNIINPETVDRSLAAIEASDKGKQSTLREFISRKYRFPILLAFLLAFFNQMSGINAVLYFAPRIFNLTGMGAEAALLQSVGVGLMMFIFTIVGMNLIDRFGRRFLMYIGSAGYILSLALIAWAFHTETFTGYFVPVMMFLFVAAHGVGQGAVIWVYISEIFPNSVRSWGASLGSATHWIFAALIAGNFVYIESLFGAAPIFALFAFMMVLQLLFVWKVMPETNGISLEDLESRLLNR